MKLKGNLNSETIEAMIRECLCRRFLGMSVTDVTLPYISEHNSSFELDDSPLKDNLPTLVTVPCATEN